jgi:hypothetical protein
MGVDTPEAGYNISDDTVPHGAVAESDEPGYIAASAELWMEPSACWNQVPEDRDELSPDESRPVEE